MDFDSEPWDATCEAEGSNTKNRGLDSPSWVLLEGDYELRIYAGEDGTALDGIYLTGPSNQAPNASRRYVKGDSTICKTKQPGMSWIIKMVALTLAIVIALVSLVFDRNGGHPKVNGMLDRIFGNRNRRQPNNVKDTINETYYNDNDNDWQKVHNSSNVKDAINDKHYNDNDNEWQKVPYDYKH